MTIKSKVSQRGQTTIPYKIRKLLDLCNGDYICYEVLKDNSIHIKKITNTNSNWKKIIEDSITDWDSSEEDDY